MPTVLLALAFVLVCAKLAGELVERLGQPAVLGELLVGIVLGNAALFGGPDTSGLVANETFTVIAELDMLGFAVSITYGADSPRRRMRPS